MEQFLRDKMIPVLLHNEDWYQFIKTLNEFLDAPIYDKLTPIISNGDVKIPQSNGFYLSFWDVFKDAVIDIYSIEALTRLCAYLKLPLDSLKFSYYSQTSDTDAEYELRPIKVIGENLVFSTMKCFAKSTDSYDLIVIDDSIFKVVSARNNLIQVTKLSGEYDLVEGTEIKNAVLVRKSSVFNTSSVYKGLTVISDDDVEKSKTLQKWFDNSEYDGVVLKNTNYTLTTPDTNVVVSNFKDADNYTLIRLFGNDNWTIEELPDWLEVESVTGVAPTTIKVFAKYFEPNKKQEFRTLDGKVFLTSGSEALITNELLSRNALIKIQGEHSTKAEVNISQSGYEIVVNHNIPQVIQGYSLFTIEVSSMGYEWFIKNNSTVDENQPNWIVVDGEPIDETKSYSGSKVLSLAVLGFNNSDFSDRREGSIEIFTNEISGNVVRNTIKFTQYRTTRLDITGKVEYFKTDNNSFLDIETDEQTAWRLSSVDSPSIGGSTDLLVTGFGYYDFEEGEAPTTGKVGKSLGCSDALSVKLSGNKSKYIWPWTRNQEIINDIYNGLNEVYGSNLISNATDKTNEGYPIHLMGGVGSVKLGLEMLKDKFVIGNITTAGYGTASLVLEYGPISKKNYTWTYDSYETLNIVRGTALARGSLVKGLELPLGLSSRGNTIKLYVTPDYIRLEPLGITTQYKLVASATNGQTLSWNVLANTTDKYIIPIGGYNPSVDDGEIDISGILPSSFEDSGEAVCNLKLLGLNSGTNEYDKEIQSLNFEIKFDKALTTKIKASGMFSGEATSRVSKKSVSDDSCSYINRKVIQIPVSITRPWL